MGLVKEQKPELIFQVAVRIYESELTKTLENFLTYFDYIKGQHTDISVNGVPGKKISFTSAINQPSIFVAFVRSGKGYAVDVLPTPDNSNIKIAEQILPTFKFTQ